jgi:hypothetical protein
MADHRHFHAENKKETASGENSKEYGNRAHFSDETAFKK